MYSTRVKVDLMFDIFLIFHRIMSLMCSRSPSSLIIIFYVLSSFTYSITESIFLIHLQHHLLLYHHIQSRQTQHMIYYSSFTLQAICTYKNLIFKIKICNAIHIFIYLCYNVTQNMIRMLQLIFLKTKFTMISLLI